MFPLSQIGAITAGQRLDIMNASSVKGKYEQSIDRESAFEILLQDSERRAAEQQALSEQKAVRQEKGGVRGSTLGKIGGAVLTAAATAAISSVSRSVGTATANAVTGKKSKTTTGKAIAGKAINNATSSALRTLTRSILGNLIK